MSNFDQAVVAVVDGDIARLRQLLDADPGLATARSAADHQATLLHYVAANGVEDELQRTPPNAVEVAELLFAHGADPNATAEFYGGGPNSTPLVSLVTSSHPHSAGLHEPLIDLFCQNGASPNGLNDDGYPLLSALAFFYPKAAMALHRNGARTDNLVAASAMGDATTLVKLWGMRETPAAIAGPIAKVVHLAATTETVTGLALTYGALCGQLGSVEFLLRQGVAVDNGPFHGQTALHYAAYAGNEQIVRFLLANGADMSIRDRQFKGLPAGWAAVAGHDELAGLLAHN